MACRAILLMLPLISFGHGSFRTGVVRSPPDNHESFWGAQEFYTQKRHLRYLLLVPANYDPRRKYELWVNLHGDPGCASHAIQQYRDEALKRNIILLAPDATDKVKEFYIRPDGKRAPYRYWFMKEDQATVWTILDEVLGKYSIDRNRVALFGFSAGCEMGWRLLASRPEQFYFFGGVANRFKHGRPPAPEAGLRQAARHVSHYFAAGRIDAYSGPYFKITVRKLKEFGFELRAENPAGIGHGLSPAEITSEMKFMEEVRGRKR